ncbi:hypothetical protein QJQ45_023002 [Haematococcus lacustris]|nr:hypothetical protein QJQ45_023002 [Haematococcus lacustris]
MRKGTTALQDAAKARKLSDALRALLSIQAVLKSSAPQQEPAQEDMLAACTALATSLSIAQGLLSPIASKQDGKSASMVTDFVISSVAWVEQLSPSKPAGSQLLQGYTLLTAMVCKLGAAFLFDPRMVGAMGGPGFKSAAEAVRAALAKMCDFSAEQLGRSWTAVSIEPGPHQPGSEADAVVLQGRELVAAVFVGLNNIGRLAQQMMGNTNQPVELRSLRNVNLGWKNLTDLLCRKLPPGCRQTCVTESQTQLLLGGCLDILLSELAVFAANPRIDRLSPPLDPFLTQVLHFWQSNITRTVEEFFTHVSPSNRQKVLAASLAAYTCLEAAEEASSSPHAGPLSPTASAQAADPKQGQGPGQAGSNGAAAPPGARGAGQAGAGASSRAEALQGLASRVAPRLSHMVLVLMDLGAQEPGPGACMRQWALECAAGIAVSLAPLLQGPQTESESAATVAAAGAAGTAAVAAGAAAAAAAAAEAATSPGGMAGAGSSGAGEGPSSEQQGRLALMLALAAQCCSRPAGYGPVTLLTLGRHLLPALLALMLRCHGPQVLHCYGPLLALAQAASPSAPHALPAPSLYHTTAPDPTPTTPTSAPAPSTSPPLSMARAAKLLGEVVQAGVGLLLATSTAREQAGCQPEPLVLEPFDAALHETLAQLCLLACSPNPVMARLATDMLCAATGAMGEACAARLLVEVGGLLGGVAGAEAAQLLQGMLGPGAEAGGLGGLGQQGKADSQGMARGGGEGTELLKVVGVLGLAETRPLVLLLGSLVQASPPAAVRQAYLCLQLHSQCLVPCSVPSAPSAPTLGSQQQGAGQGGCSSLDLAASASRTCLWQAFASQGPKTATCSAAAAAGAAGAAWPGQGQQQGQGDMAGPGGRLGAAGGGAVQELQARLDALRQEVEAVSGQLRVAVVHVWGAGTAGRLGGREVLALSLQLCGAGAPALLTRHTAHCLGWLLEGQAASVDALLQAAGPGQARLLGPEGGWGGWLDKRVHSFLILTCLCAVCNTLRLVATSALAVAQAAASCLTQQQTHLAHTSHLTRAASAPLNQPPTLPGSAADKPSSFPALEACMAPALRLLATLLACSKFHAAATITSTSNGSNGGGGGGGGRADSPILPRSVLAALAAGPLGSALQASPSARPHAIPLIVACAALLDPTPVSLVHDMLHTCLEEQKVEPETSEPGLVRPASRGHWALQHEALAAVAGCLREARSRALATQLMLPCMMPSQQQQQGRQGTSLPNLFQTYGRQQLVGEGAGPMSHAQLQQQAHEEQQLARLLHSSCQGRQGGIEQQNAVAGIADNLAQCLGQIQQAVAAFSSEAAASRGQQAKHKRPWEPAGDDGPGQHIGTAGLRAWGSGNAGIEDHHPHADASGEAGQNGRNGSGASGQLNKLAAAGATQVAAVRKQLDILQSVVSSLLSPASGSSSGHDTATGPGCGQGIGSLVAVTNTPSSPALPAMDPGSSGVTDCVGVAGLKGTWWVRMASGSRTTPAP